MTGTMRSYSQEVRKKALEDLERVIKSACDGVGATYKFVNEPAVNPLINHYCASQLLKETLEETIGADHVKIMRQPATASEDFSNYLFKVPGTFMWLGCSSGAVSYTHLRWTYPGSAARSATWASTSTTSAPVWIPPSRRR